jgi:hypothetical protein
MITSFDVKKLKVFSKIKVAVIFWQKLQYFESYFEFSKQIAIFFSSFMPKIFVFISNHSIGPRCRRSASRDNFYTRLLKRNENVENFVSVNKISNRGTIFHSQVQNFKLWYTPSFPCTKFQTGVETFIPVQNISNGGTILLSRIKHFKRGYKPSVPGTKF